VKRQFGANDFILTTTVYTRLITHSHVVANKACKSLCGDNDDIQGGPKK